MKLVVFSDAEFINQEDGACAIRWHDFTILPAYHSVQIFKSNAKVLHYYIGSLELNMDYNYQGTKHRFTIDDLVIVIKPDYVQIGTPNEWICNIVFHEDE